MTNSENPAALPVMILTGASGIVGRHFLEFIKDDFIIYAIARRSQLEAGIPGHKNIKWLQADIANFTLFKSVVKNALKKNKFCQIVDFILHLASYYDFTYTYHPEYRRTNVVGTKNVLELAKDLKVKHLIFTSSLAGIKFPARGETISEKNPIDAIHPYALSKKNGEKLVEDYSKHYRCSIIRPAAVFTDWCEYGILYMLLSRWFSGKFSSRILEGKGEFGVPYIHCDDLNKLIVKILKKSNELPMLGIYIASPNGSTTHKELYEIAVKFYFGKKIKPIYCPKPIVVLAITIKMLLGRLFGNLPFERPWMLKYIDKQLNTDSSRTREILSWTPTPRFHIRRRILYLVEKIKTHPEEWHIRNTRAMKRIPQRPNLLIYEVMVKLKQEITGQIKQELRNPVRKKEFANYQRINLDNFNWDINVFYQLLTASVRNKDRLLLLNYIHELLIPLRFNEGFEEEEVCTAVLEAGKIIISKLINVPELKGLEGLIHDLIFLTIQLTIDEVENSFEKLNRNRSELKVPQRSIIEAKLNELATFCINEETCNENLK